MTTFPTVQLDSVALEGLKRRFLTRHAGFERFTGPAGDYPWHERDYKDALVTLFNETIDASLFEGVIGQGQAVRIAEAVVVVLTRRLPAGTPQNLLPWRYSVFLRSTDFLRPNGPSESDVVAFARAFGDLLYGTGDAGARVERFNGVMWPIWKEGVRNLV